MCCLFGGKEKTYLVILSDFLYQIYVKGLVYNFHHLISLEVFNRMLLFHLILLNMVN